MTEVGRLLSGRCLVRKPPSRKAPMHEAASRHWCLGRC